MEETQTRDALRDLGWGKSKASCYCALVQYGEMKASEIANHTGLRQEKVYNPLSRLENEGYVYLTGSNPKRYKAQNPRYVMDQEKEKFKEDTNQILEDLEEAWARSEEGIPTTGDHARVLSGKGGMRTGKSEIIEKATDSLDIIDSQFALTSPKDIEGIESLLEEGAKVRIVAQESEQTSHLQEIGANIHHPENIINSSYYIADELWVMLNVSNRRATVMFEDRYFADIITKEFQEIYQEDERV